MAKDCSTMEDSNRSSNPSIHELCDPARRSLLRGGLGAAVATLLAPLAGCASGGGSGTALLGFKSVPIATADAITVAEGYSFQVIAPWGDPAGLSGENAAFKFDASNSAVEQEAQIGMHHDGIHFFSQNGSTSGLLVMNHEYGDVGLLHADGMKTTPDGRTMFINIQHPGESPSERSEPVQPRRVSNWPDNNPAGRPRSATVVIRKNDGGVIGA
jgi:uncharacterized protein